MNKSIAQLSQELGAEKHQLRKLIKDNNIKHTELKGKTYLYNPTTIAEIVELNQAKFDSTSKGDTNTHPDVLNVLTKQLDIKDEQIRELNKRLEAYEQQMSVMTMLTVKQQNEIIVLEDKLARPKPNLFQRLFRGGGTIIESDPEL